MKAKDYFLKYDEQIMEEAKRPETKTDGPMAKMYIDFFKETGDIAEQRRVKFDRGLIPVIDEQNKKVECGRKFIRQEVWRYAYQKRWV